MTPNGLGGETLENTDETTGAGPGGDEGNEIDNEEGISTGANDEGSEEDLDEHGQPLTKEGAEPSPVQKRINKLTAETKNERKLREDAERQANYWRGVAEGRTPTTDKDDGKQATPPSGPPTPPVPSDYEGGIYDPSYIADHDSYLIEAARYAYREEEKLRTERDRGNTVHETFVARLKEAAVSDPEMMTMFEDPSFLPVRNPSSVTVASIIKESEVAPFIFKELYKDPDKTRQILAMTPIQIAREVGRMEEKIMSKTKGGGTPPNRVSQAPKPTTKVNNGNIASAIVDEDNLPMDEYVKRRNQKQFGKAKG